MTAAHLLVLAFLLALWRGPLWRPRPLPGVTRARPWLIGHRGVIGRLPENGLAAFRFALEAGLDGVETDVQRTRDGVLVLVHDAQVEGRRVTESSATELAEDLPSLSRLVQLLELLRQHPGTLLNLELKTHGRWSWELVRAVARALRGSALQDRVLVSSFDPLALALLRLAAPELRTAYLWRDAPALPRWLRNPWPAGWLHVDAIHPHHTAVDEALMERARERGLLVNVWTVNDPAEVQRLRSLGVSGIMSDDPDVAMAASDRGGAR